MTLRFLFFFVILTWVQSCGPVVSVTRLADSTPHPKSVDDPIKVYMTNKPECVYEELALLAVSEGAFSGGFETFVEAMKHKARELGGDAILVNEVGRHASGYVAVSPKVVGAVNSNTMNATVIRFTDKDCVH